MLYILNINITSLSSNVITLEVDLRFPCYLSVLPSFKIGDMPKGGKVLFLIYSSVFDIISLSPPALSNFSNAFLKHIVRYSDTVYILLNLDLISHSSKR